MTNIYKQNGYPKFALAAVLIITSLTQGASAAVTTTDEPAQSILESIVSTVTGSVDEIIQTEEEYRKEEITACANQIDNFIAQWPQLPMNGYGEAFATAAYNEGKDCELAKLVATKALLESTFGKFTPPNARKNAFGWGCSTIPKCINFKSYEEGINVVTKNLAGNNPRTERLYANKDIKEIVLTYNSVNPKYLQNVLSTMKKIDSMPTELNNDQLASR